MNKTPIEWTDWSVNPLKLKMPDGTLINACVHKSEGCRNCYAEGIVRRWWKKEWGEFPGYTPALLKLGEPVLVEKDLKAVLKLSSDIEAGKVDPNENKIFWNDMTDEFLEFWPDELLDKIWAVRALTPNLIHQVLTKRADRMHDYLTGKNYQARHYQLESLRLDGEAARHSDIRCEIVSLGGRDGYDRIGGLEWPLSNVWSMVSVEDESNVERIIWLLRTPAAVRGVSYEPGLGPVNFTRIPTGSWAHGTVDVMSGYLCGEEPDELYDLGADPQGWIRKPAGDWERGQHGIDWIIVGGESGPGARPFDIQWARDTIAQCKAASVACFVKQLGTRPIDYGRSLQPKDQSLSKRHAQWVIRDKKGGDWNEWPEDLRVREYPQ